MKKILLTAVVAIATTASVWACDLCGYSVGLNPNFNQNQIGLRFRYRDFVGHHTHSDGQTHGADRETYLTTELWARWCPHPKLRIQVLLPFAQNTAYNDGEIDQRIRGVGDASALAYYQVVQRVDSNPSGWQHRLFVGGGLGMPSGKWRPKVVTEYEPLLMPGTGAWSGMAALSYMLRKGHWGLGLDYNYRISTANALGYRFADRHNFSANLYYQWKSGDFALLPFAGMYAEYARKDQTDAVRAHNTGGIAAFGSVGMEVYLGRFSVNLTAQLPLVQSLNGQQGQNHPRFNGGLFYSF
jgi:hypothetical protein